MYDVKNVLTEEQLRAVEVAEFEENHHEDVYDDYYDYDDEYNPYDDQAYYQSDEEGID